MTNPSVTFVCPTYNRTQYLPTAIRCFLQQVYDGDKELIIVDDSDEPAEIHADARIQYVRLDARTPTGTKRNIGSRIARGDILISLDDDDWSHPYRLKDQVQRLLKTGKAVTGYNASILFDVTTSQIHKIRGGPPYFASGSSQCYWKSWWREHPYPDCSFGEDSVFSRTARLTDELAISEPGKMLVVRRHATNTSEVYLPRLQKLTAEDVSKEFWRAIKSPLPKHLYITDRFAPECEQEALEQYDAPVVDYRVDKLPEVVTR